MSGKNCWHWVPALEDAICDDCLAQIREGEPAAWNHFDKRTICEPCAREADIHPRVSKAFREARLAEARGPGDLLYTRGEQNWRDQ